MGKLIAFSSSIHGQCATTASMVAVALHVPNSLVVHTQSRFAELENMFFRKLRNKDVYKSIGIQNLCYEFKGAPTTAEDIKKNIIPVTENLSLLPSADRAMSSSDHDRILFHIVTEELPKYFDNVFVDLGAGSSEMIQRIREIADVNVIVVSQSVVSLCDISDIPNAVVLIGRYDKDRKTNYKSIKNHYKTPVYCIPECSEYADSINDGAVSKFFYSYYAPNAYQRIFASPDEAVQEFFTSCKTIGDSLNEFRTDKKY